MKALSLGPVVALVLTLSACSSLAPEDDPLDPLTRGLIGLSAIDGFAGVELDGDAVTLLTRGERPGARAAAQASLGADVALDVRVVPEQGRGSESLKNRVAGAVSDFLWVDYNEVTGYVDLGVTTADAVRRAQVELGVLPQDREWITVQVSYPVRPL